MSKIVLLVFSVCFVSNVLFGQATVRGKVTDASGESLVGCAIKVLSTSKGAVSNEDGRYAIQLPAGDYVLEVEYIGFLKKQKALKLKNQSVVTLDFVLEEDVSSLNEFVAIGYGQKRKSELIGSIVKVDGDELAEMPTPSFENALQGKVAGLDLLGSGGIAGSGSLIRIRGVASISSAGDPLYIIDGVAVSQDYFRDGNSGAMNSNPLAALNPQDIESVEVLKDAAATSIYGSRGSNGVILITTKNAKKEGWSFELNSRISSTSPTYRPNMLETDDYLQLYQEAWENDGGVGLAPLPNGISWEDARKTNTNWVDELLGNGLKQLYSVGTFYKKKDFNAYFNVTRDATQGILTGNEYNKNAVRLNLEFKPLKNMTLKMSNGLTLAENKRVNAGWSGGLGSAMSTALPIYPIKDSTGNWSLSHANPVAGNELIDWEENEIRYLNSLSLNYNITDKLSFRLSGGFDYSKMVDDIFEPYLFSGGSLDTGVARRGIGKKRTATYNAVASYQVLDDEQNKLSVLFGSERIFENNGGSFYMRDSMTASFLEKGLSEDSSTLSGGASYALQSVFTRVEYQRNGKYFGNIVLRTDGSSRFGPDKRWGFFPAVGTGWIISKEKFMRRLPKINYLKLKAGFGISGNMPPDNDLWRQTWIGTTNNINYGGNPTAYPIRLENPNLQWDESYITDITLEGGAFKNRITWEVSAYNKLTKQVLSQLSTPSSLGFGSTWVNGLDIRNRGIEVLLTTRNIVKPNIYWETQFSISRNYNELLSLGVYQADAISGGTNDTRVIIGEPIGTNFLVRFSHIDQQTGRPVYLDAEGNTTSQWKNTNRVPVGSVIPKAFGSLVNNVRYKNWNLNINVYYKLGGNVYNSSLKRQNGVVTDWNMTTDYFDRWTQPGDDAKYPKLSMNTDEYGLPNDPYQNNHTLFLSEVNYFRLRNLGLSYTFPQSKLGDRLNSLSVGASLFNFFTFTQFVGADPEIARDFDNPTDRNMSGGIIWLSPPQERSINFNISLKF